MLHSASQGSASSLALGATITGGTANRVLFADASQLLAESPSLVFSGGVLSVSGSISVPTIGTVTAASLNLRVNSSNVIVLSNSTGTGVQFIGYGAGAITSDGSGNLTSASDESIKNNIRPFTTGLDAILQIKPILHGYTLESGLDQTITDYAGFSANQVEGIIPEAVRRSPDGLRSFSDRPVIAALVNAIHELTARIETLEARR